MFINQYIKKIRTELKIGQDEFSEKIGLTRSNLSQIERGKSKPTYNTLLKIVNEFHIDANLLFGNDNYCFKKNDLNNLSEPEIDYSNTKIDSREIIIKL